MELAVATIIASMIGIAACMVMRLATDAKTKRDDAVQVITDAREAMDMIQRLLDRATDQPGQFLDNMMGSAGNPSPYGIQFWANVDQTPGLRRYWVWIWTDPTQLADQVNFPSDCDRRLPLKIAAFSRICPGGGPGNLGWTKPTDYFYQHVNHNQDVATWPDNLYKAHLMVACNASLQFDVWPHDAAAPYPADANPQNADKRVTIWGGFYDTHGTADPGWGFVAPGSFNPSTQRIPSFTVSKTIYPRSLHAGGWGVTMTTPPGGPAGKQAMWNSEVSFISQRAMDNNDTVTSRQNSGLYR